MCGAYGHLHGCEHACVLQHVCVNADLCPMVRQRVLTFQTLYASSGKGIASVVGYIMFYVPFFFAQLLYNDVVSSRSCGTDPLACI